MAGDAWVYAMLIAGMLGITYLMKSSRGHPAHTAPGAARPREFLQQLPPDKQTKPAPPPSWPPRHDPLYDVRLALSQALAPGPVAEAEGDPRYELPFDREEMRRVMTTVVERIDEQQPHLQLHLISVDAARKFGRPRKQLTYVAALTVYSKGRSLACTVHVVADVEGNGAVVLRSLRLQNATDEKNELQPSSSVPQFAEFEDVFDTVRQ